MKRNYKKPSVLLAVIMMICVFATYTATADGLCTPPSQIEVQGGYSYLSTYYLEASVVDEDGNAAPEMGSVNPEKAEGKHHNIWPDQGSIIVTAEENAGYEFVGWDYTQELHCIDDDVYQEQSEENKIMVVFGGKNQTKYVRAVFRLIEEIPPTQPNVGITKTVEKSKAYAGDNVKYTISVTNTGDTWLTDVIVYDDLLEKSWLLRILEPGDVITFDYNYVIPANTPVNDTITNTATVYANEYYELLSVSLMVEDGDILYEEEGNLADGEEYGGDFGLEESASATVTVIEKTKKPRDPERRTESGTYTLTMAVDGEGTVSPGVGVSEWSKGTNVKLTATPAEGWKFDGWQGDSVSESDLLYMNGNKSVRAVFSLIEEEAEEVIEDDSIPQAPATEDEEIEDQDVPAAPAEELPKTGGVPASVFYGLGGLITALGALLRRKTIR